MLKIIMLGIKAFDIAIILSFGTIGVFFLGKG
jgi:hypothetical protein